MATNPFGGLGLGQMGSENKYFSEPQEVPDIITGLKDIAVVGIKNMRGIPASMPVPAHSSKPVAPYTGVAPIAPVNFVSPAITPANKDLHPELNSTLQTQLF